MLHWYFPSCYFNITFLNHSCIPISHPTHGNHTWLMCGFNAKPTKRMWTIGVSSHIRNGFCI